MQERLAGSVRRDEAAPRRVPVGKPPATRQQVAAILAGVAVLLGGGGGAGYVLHGTTAQAAPAPDERLQALWEWKAAETALRERDREERAALTGAIRDSNVTNGAVRDAVIALTERLGAVERFGQGIDSRVRALEASGVRPAVGKR